jgi:hypothetical protein
MKVYLPQRRNGAVARTAVRGLPSFHAVVGIYFFGTGVLALILALSH